MSKITFYGYILCPFCQRVKFALEALKIDYDYVEVDLYVNEQKSEEYKKINPFQKVPSIVYNGKIIYESQIIIEFLADEFGMILPKDSVERSQQRIWANYFDQNVSSRFYDLILCTKQGSKQEMSKLVDQILASIKYFTKNSGLFSRIKQDNSSFYNGTDQLSYTDFIIIPHFRVFEMFLRLISSIDIFASKNDENDDHENILKIFQIYIQNVMKTDEYLSANDKLKELPSADKCQVLKLQQLSINQSFSYEQLFKLYIETKYLA